MARIKERYPGKWYLLVDYRREDGSKAIKKYRLKDVTSQEQAEQYLEGYRAALTLRKFEDNGLILPNSFKRRRKPLISFDEAVDVYLEERLLQYRSEKDRRNRKSRVNTHLVPFFGNMYLPRDPEYPEPGEIGQTDIAAYKIKRQKDGVSSTTIRMELRAFKGILDYAEERLGWNGGFKVKLPVAKRLNNSNFLAFDEIRPFLQACEPIYQRAAMLAIFNGLRLSEVLNLTWSDIDFTRKVLYIREGKTESSDRVIAVHPEAWTGVLTIQDFYKQRLAEFKQVNPEKRIDLLRRIQSRIDSPYIFPGYYGGKRTTFQHSHKKAMESSGVAGVTFHGLRHTFIMLALRFGGDVAGVAKSAGHKSIRTTVEIYDHLHLDQQRAIIGQIQLPGNPVSALNKSELPKKLA